MEAKGFDSTQACCLHYCCGVKIVSKGKVVASEGTGTSALVAPTVVGMSRVRKQADSSVTTSLHWNKIAALLV
jgi:hypothetical protein